MISKHYLTATAVYTVIMTNVLSGTIVNVALPQLAEEFGVSDSAITWIVNALQMIIPMTMLSFSAIGDRWGYRRVFLTGTVLFLIGSLLCAWSTSFEGLVAARILQGIGASCGMSVNTALLRLIFPPKILGRAMGVNAMVVAVSAASGPTLSGLLLKHFAWPSLFYFNIPFCLTSLCIGYLLLPNNERSDHRIPFDWAGAILNALFFGSLLYGVEVYAHGNNLPLTAALILFCLAIGIYYIRREAGKKAPVFPVDLMHIKLFSLSVGTSICSFTAQQLALVSLPFFMYNILHFNPVQIGLMLTPWPLATTLSAPTAARLIEKFPAGAICSIGMSIFAAGLFSLYMLPENPSAPDIIWRMILCGFGFGFFQTPNNVTLISSAPRQRSGSASGMLGTARVVGQTLGTTMVAFFFRFFSDEFKSQACLIAGISMALIAAVVSSLRISSQTNRQN